ncbi:ABC transporter ATP-binding protein [Thiothrix lacustris]|uniref:ABC transporter ATP-binding protein n=1 Tax=Thiothrix lacustris TaxID=525917 RepID=UPI00048AF694|nr:ABC transporter ATP-binding protein [Thiothrix lacustris]
MSSDSAITVTNVGKNYHIYEKPHHRLWQMFPKNQRTWYRDFWALQDVSFQIKKGETVGIIGRNGSGKSTLLQMICGTLTPSTGTIDVNGRVAALLELGAGFNPEFSGRENVYMAASLYGLSHEDVDGKMQDIIAFSDIADFMDQPVKTYSSGMYVRLAFAVIAHVDADILVIDEALAVGDIFFTQKCMRFLRDFKRNGTILFVTHDTNSVISLCDRAIWLDKSKMKKFDAVKIVCESYLEELYASNSSKITTESSASSRAFVAMESFRDVRQDIINQSFFRNDLEVFRFSDAGEDFGTGLVQLKDAYFTCLNQKAVSWFIGGEVVDLHIVAHSKIKLFSPIVGFLVKNKLGQNLFGDNTFLSYINQRLVVEEGEYFSAAFQFRMPLMPSGDYTVGIAIADGTQESHVVHHWIHDAIVFKSHSDSVSTGLVGIPMLKIELGPYEQQL